VNILYVNILYERDLSIVSVVVSADMRIRFGLCSLKSYKIPFKGDFKEVQSR